MDFNSLKDINNIKTLFKGVANEVVIEAKKVKDVNADKLKKGFNKYFVEYLKKNYAKFEGRVSRRQYWMFALYSSLIGLAIAIITGLMPFLSIFSVLYLFAILVPSVGLGICRLHDINLSGWFFLLSLIPYVGGLALVVLFSLPGDNEDNDYGQVEN